MNQLNLLQKHCILCPHECEALRLQGRSGICGAADEPGISSVCLHRGEEPVISGKNGICNVFFSRCNLQCIFCQNYQISNRRGKLPVDEISYNEAIETIVKMLGKGIRTVGFVSPSHRIDTMLTIIEEIRSQGFAPVFIYNSNGYDKIDILSFLDPYINVYLPDFKYADDQLAFELSGIKNYTATALKALKEMVRQKGTALFLNENDEIEKGVIVRHLVLPGYIENSKRVIDILAENFSANLHISLMSQYQPTDSVKNHPKLGRKLYPEEYLEVADHLESRGFYKGWVQEFDSSGHYNPDFSKEYPFEDGGI